MQPTQKIYDDEAGMYDLFNAPMEMMFKKGRRLFSALRGRIFEIGVGTGTNLQYYHPSAEIYAMDWSPNMILQARLKIHRYRLKNIKWLRTGDAQTVSSQFPANYFDYVTSTCVFCSVPDPIKGLKEILKILKPGGKFIQLEHGLSNNRVINVGMRAVDPLTYKHRGVHIARNHLAILQKAGFEVLHMRDLDLLGITKAIISRKL